MTEPEWLSSTDPSAMLEFLEGKASDRKLQLFAAGCLLAIRHRRDGSGYLHQTMGRLTEQFADGMISVAEFRRVWRANGGASDISVSPEEPWEWIGFFVDAEEMATQPLPTYLRCIFNPFALPIDPSWQTSTVLSLALGIYTDRAFNRLPILADALEDASCDNADLLNHCRFETVHTRGCWALDLVLGK